MEKFKVLEVKIEDMENAGCTNGNYPDVKIITTVGSYYGKTCRCGHGCSNTLRIDHGGWEGDITNIEFKDEADFFNFLDS